MTETGQRVVVVDLRIPFVRLVLFFVKRRSLPFLQPSSSVFY
jgi:hypothetical protein